jgi:hypothetical protein
MSKAQLQTNSPILSASNHEAISGPLIPSQEFVQKMIQLVFPEIVEIERESEPDLRDLLVQRLERRLLSDQVASRERDPHKSF